MAKISLCVYSESGSGKSTLAVELLEWIRANLNPNAKAKVMTVEHKDTYQESVNKGLIKVWDLNTRELPFEAIDAAVHGRWPEDPEDGKSKILGNSLEDLAEYPLRVYEGLSTMSDYAGGSYVTGGLGSRAGRKERVGPAEETISFMDGTLAVGGNARSHYNIIQTFIRGAVANSHKLPVFNLWTAHEQKAKDDLSGLPLVGPEVFGNKATQHVSRWFSNMLYLSKKPFEKQVEIINGKGVKEKVTTIENEYFLWLKDHYEPTSPSVPIKAKNSLGARNQKDVPAFLAGGGLAIGQYMDLLVKFGILLKEGE